jgi:hypothetical protein
MHQMNIEEERLKSFVKIFEISSKKDLLRYCKNLTIHSDDFVNIILAAEAGVIGYRHRIHYRDIVPKHLHPKPEEIQGQPLAEGSELQGKPLKFFNKVRQIFRDRRYLVGHMFYSPNLKYWHFFYFDQRDLDKYQNRWKHGPHIHFLNYLWPEHTCQSVWNKFIAENPTVRSSIHIRYVDPPYET